MKDIRFEVVVVPATCPSSMTSRFHRTWRRGDTPLIVILQWQSGTRAAAPDGTGQRHVFFKYCRSVATFCASALRPTIQVRVISNDLAVSLTRVRQEYDLFLCDQRTVNPNKMELRTSYIEASSSAGGSARLFAAYTRAVTLFSQCLLISLSH